MKMISILRGINVSGQKQIKMADLVNLFESLGFNEVTTYIQSGNVIFSGDDSDLESLKIQIEEAIERTFHFHVPVILRTHDDLSRIIHACPFGEIDANRDGTKYLVTFLSSEPSEDKIIEIGEFVIAPERLEVINREVFLYCPNGYGKSKLSNTFLEKKLGVFTTTRNWKTVLKLRELSS